MNPIPMTVLLPTRDAMSMLPSHVKGLQGWAALAREIVVVDSQSKDGTLDYIRDHLKHPNLSFHSRPPGLYQAWNFGVTKAACEYLYVSTVGDGITAEGLTHLYEVARRFRAPVTLSEPELVNADGTPSDKIWPIGQILQEQGLTSPGVLTKAVSFIYAATSIPKSTLGSSASNLYETEFLRRHPFPCDYGLSGDVALGVEQSLNVPFAVTPMKCATFMFHDKTYSKKEYEVDDLSLRLCDLARECFAKCVVDESRDEPVFPDGTTRREMDQLLACLRAKHLAKQRVKRLRLGKFPWQINPLVWRARRVSRQAHADIGRIRRRLLDQWAGAGGRG